MRLSVHIQGISEIQERWIKSKWQKKIAVEAVFTASAHMDDEITKNLQKSVYNGRERAWKLQGFLKNGRYNKSTDNGMKREIVSNPQLSGSKFNYGPSMDTGHKEIVPKRAKILASPISRYNLSGVYPANSKKFPKLSSNGKFVLIGRKVKATSGTHYFSNSVKSTKSIAKMFISEAFSRFKPK
jgi:hypothetical protein